MMALKLLCSPSWPGTQEHPPASGSQVLILQASAKQFVFLPESAFVLLTSVTLLPSRPSVMAAQEVQSVDLQVQVTLPTW